MVHYTTSNEFNFFEIKRENLLTERICPRRMRNQKERERDYQFLRNHLWPPMNQLLNVFKVHRKETKIHCVCISMRVLPMPMRSPLRIQYHDQYMCDTHGSSEVRSANLNETEQGNDGNKKKTNNNSQRNKMNTFQKSRIDNNNKWPETRLDAHHRLVWALLLKHLVILFYFILFHLFLVGRAGMCMYPSTLQST